LKNIELRDLILEILRDVGDVKAKPMFGTFNINLDGVNLGLLCVDMGNNRWYIKKTAAGSEFLAQSGIELESCIKGKNYYITDYSNKEMICKLAEITRDELLKSKNI
jgi:TfoX/Sxy family transcriptional regulator of competence genes